VSTMGKSLGSAIRGIGVLGVVAALMAGCTHAIPIKASLEAPPNVAQVPVAVGVYYSAEFRAYEHLGARFGDRWAFPLGQGSVALFDRVFPVMFERTFPVQSLPPLNPGGPQLAAVIEPKIEEFDFTLPMLKTGTFSAEITYRFTLYSPQGDPVASWTVKGVGAKPGEIGFELARWPGEAADLAMQDAATKFISGFRDVPEVRQWLRRVGAPGAGLIPCWLHTLFKRG
jgi:hypothetical protein